MLVPDISKISLEGQKDNNIVTISNINEEVEIFERLDMDNEKEVKKATKVIEGIVRHSPEYSSFIGYLKNRLSFTKCIFHPEVDISVLKRTKLEFHHYPFTLYDISRIVLEKYMRQNNVFNPFEVSEEVMKLHYDLKVGLVPLSKTMHELAHSGKKFINLKYVSQSYLKFIAEYSAYIPDELIQNWKNLKELSFKEDTGELKEQDILERVSLIVDMQGVGPLTPINVAEYTQEAAATEK